MLSPEVCLFDFGLGYDVTEKSVTKRIIFLSHAIDVIITEDWVQIPIRGRQLDIRYEKPPANCEICGAQQSSVRT